MPTVSVIIPTHNREALIGRAIASVRAQTFGDWELIVVDDGSRDETTAIVERVASLDSRVRLLRQESHRGANAARNAGVRQARGQWIALQDSDDEWLPRRLEAQLDWVRECEAGGGPVPGVLGSWSFEQSASGARHRVAPEPEGDAYRALLRAFFGTSATLLIRRDVFDRVGLFDESMRSCQEYEFLLRATREFAFVIVPEELAVTHVHSGPRSAGNPQGYRVLCERYGEEIRAHWGRRALASRWTFVGTLYRNAGHLTAAARHYLHALKEWPLAMETWARLLLLPLYLPRARKPGGPIKETDRG